MFVVSASPRPPPNLQSSPLHCVRAADPLRAHHAVTRRPRPPGPQLSPHRMYPACDPRQGAKKFNQKIEFTDTSQVTDMAYMFNVRFLPAP